ncbi:EAL domain-containing protein [Pseudoalteromonas sp. C2R02]|uniref:putative bifunctional diguanylate cyclase/phosphodiesterase n=1 Tax=Pseudoalteromonas sp. C2R02 TaxID=2841565 RepID=UPI001C083402|nr:EAL domain-containing protein [Pseudoalteromonas sp. C2R02]MBU2971932.1 EAL domain-containing protein [Pseudoalteromonas sp. C2R02]
MKAKAKSELTSSKRLVWFTSALLLLLLIWQTFSSTKEHYNYQLKLMDSVTDNILSDYLDYLAQLRLEIDLFQQKNIQFINKLQDAKGKADKQTYLFLLDILKKDINNTRLFAFIDESGHGKLSHITGDFLPSCKEEISSTLENGTQDRLFLHYSKSSVHFDLLQPLLVQEDNNFLFVAFNPDVLQSLLNKYQLPHQQLFLMRTDKSRKIELSSASAQDKYPKLIMTSEDYNNFSFIKKIPSTRWQIAIKLDDSYNKELLLKGLVKAVLIWFTLSIFIYIFYRVQKSRITKQSEMKTQLVYSNNYDNLTGLNNRQYFIQCLNKVIDEKHQESITNTGVVFHIDLDKFQVINNNFGYAFGDKFLNFISHSLLDFLSEPIIISRLGNDEFALLHTQLPHEDAESFSKEIQEFFSKLNFQRYEKTATITASIGVVKLDCYQQDSQQVFSSLAQAVYLAKEKGRDRYQLYQSNDLLLIQHADEMNAVHDVTWALSNNRFVLYRQEIRALYDKPNTYFEVLIRLKNEDDKLISPALFIPAAEKYGLIIQLDRWVIERTFLAISELEHKLTDDKQSQYSINLSGLTLTDPLLYDYIKEKMLLYKINAKNISFEVTETSAITHIKSALVFMNKINLLGCHFSLDDFGSGFSSFSYLQKLPINIIKIDGMFIRDIHINEVNSVFVENIQRTAKIMGKKTVAEFVEDALILKKLNEIGVDYVQGYHIHKPEKWF